MAHGEAFQTHAEGEAGILVRINAAVAQHLGVHHAGAQHFDPALALAGGAALAAALVALDVYLAGGLGEGEMVGTEPGDGIGTVDGLDDGVQCALQVRHGHALVHHQTLDLMEHGGVGSVHLVLAVHPAGGDHADGYAVLLHGPDLHGRSLGPQEDLGILSEIEGVRPVTGGVGLRGVELGEVVAFQLDLRAVHDLKAHVKEHLLDLIQHGVHGVLVAQSHLLAGDGDVQRLGLQLGFQSGLFQNGGLGLHGLFHGGADLVGHLAHDGALLSRETAHQLEDGGQFTLFAQVLHPQRVQFRRGLRAGDGFQSALADGFQLFFHHKRKTPLYGMG